MPLFYERAQLMKTLKEAALHLHDTFHKDGWLVAAGVGADHIVLYTMRKRSAKELASVKAEAHGYEVDVTVTGQIRALTA